MNKKEVQTRQIKRIESDRARRLAYKKRKECIMKKAMELATLCGVAVCLIVFRPSGELETWPKNPSDVKAVIQMNRDYQSSKIEGKKKAIRVEEEEIEIDDDDDNQKKEENSKTLWDLDMSWFHGLSTESVKELLGMLQVKIWVIESRMEFLKIIDDNKYIGANSAHWLDLCPPLDDGDDLTTDGEDKDIVNWLRMCQEHEHEEQETGQVMANSPNRLDLNQPLYIASHEETGELNQDTVNWLRMCQEDEEQETEPLYMTCQEETGQVMANSPNRLDLNQPLYIQPHHTVTDLNPPLYIQPHHIVAARECDYCRDGGGSSRNFIDNVNTVPLRSGEILEETETHSKKTYNLLQLAHDVVGGATCGTNDNVNTVPLRLDLNIVPMRSDDETVDETETETETNSNKTYNYLQLFPMNPPQS